MEISLRLSFDNSTHGKVRDVIEVIEHDGWFHVRTRGSHRHYQHPQKPGLVTVAGHPSIDYTKSCWFSRTTSTGHGAWRTILSTVPCANKRIRPVYP